MKRREKFWLWILIVAIATGIFLGNQNKFMDTNSSACNWYSPGGLCPMVFSWKWFLGGFAIVLMLGILFEVLSEDDENRK